MKIDTRHKERYLFKIQDVRDKRYTEKDRRKDQSLCSKCNIMDQMCVRNAWSENREYVHNVIDRVFNPGPEHINWGLMSIMYHFSEYH